MKAYLVYNANAEFYGIFLDKEKAIAFAEKICRYFTCYYIDEFVIGEEDYGYTIWNSFDYADQILKKGLTSSTPFVII